MKKLTSLFLALTMAAGILSGCAGGEEGAVSSAAAESGSTAESSSSESGSAENGSTAAQEVTVAISSTFATLDPALISTTHMSHVYNNMGDTFYKTDASGALQNELGESVKVSDNGLTYTFKIKDGLLWSDGEPLTAEHFVYGLKRTIGYGPDNAYTKRNLTSFISGAAEAANNQLDVADMTDVGVEALDDTTFQITLESPCPYFERLFSSNTTAPVRPDFAPEHDSSWSVSGAYPSCGPMVLESISPEEDAVLVKNENYWNADAVTLDKATFVVMTDATAQLNAFRTGDIDIAMSVPAETADNSEFADNFARPEKYISNYFILINGGPKNTIPALQDANIRKALAMAIDKTVMIEVLGGNGYNIQLDGFIPYGFEDADGSDFRDSYSYYEYNIEEARSLMEAAGYSEENRLSFPYLYSNGDIHEDIAVLLQQMWSQIYVDLELTSVEQGVFYDYVDNGDFTTCRYANNDSTDPLSYFQIFATDSQIDGCQSITDPVYDQMIAEAYTITDNAEYMAKLHEIEDYFVGEMQYVIPLMTQTPVVLAQSNLEGLWLTVTGSPMITGITVK